MRSRRFVTLTLLWALLGSASAVRSQPAAIGNPRPPLPPRTISGVVVNSVTGLPIARVLVQAGQHAMLTDSEGHFEFRDVIENSVLFANKPGYFTEPGAWIGGWSSPSNKQDSLEIKLVPEAIISGHVTDPSGAPLEGVSVMLRTLTVSNGLKHWEQRTNAVTNAEGEFRIADLQAGEYAIQTALKLDGPPEGDAVAGYAPADYPALGTNGAGALQVHAGDQLEAEISTRLETLYPVSGVVSGLHETFPSFTVRTAGGIVINAAPQFYPQTGMFRMLLPSGSFEVRAMAYDVPQLVQSGGQMVVPHMRQQFTAQQSVTVAEGPVSGLRMTLEPMAAVPVEVALEKTAKSQASDTNQLPFNFSLLSAGADAIPMSYYPAESMNSAHPAQGLQTGDPLVIRNLPPGQYVLQGGGQSSWYIASAVCGGTDLTREPLTIAGSAAGCSLHVVLRDDAASLEIVTSHAGESRPTPAFVYVVPLNNLTRDVQALPTVPDGKLSLDGVAPGQYLLLATPQMEQLAYRDAESLRRYETEGKRIDLSPGEKTEIRLDVLTGEP